VREREFCFCTGLPVESTGREGDGKEDIRRRKAREDRKEKGVERIKGRKAEGKNKEMRKE
jgi:hypothetical protein